MQEERKEDQRGASTGTSAAEMGTGCQEDNRDMNMEDQNMRKDIHTGARDREERNEERRKEDD